METLQLTIQFLVIHHEPIQKNVIIGELLLPLVKYEFVDEELNLCHRLKEYKAKPVSQLSIIQLLHILFIYLMV